MPCCIGGRLEGYDGRSDISLWCVQLLDSAQFTGHQKARLLQLRETYLRNVAQLAKARAAYEVKTGLKTCYMHITTVFSVLQSLSAVHSITSSMMPNAAQCCCGQLSAGPPLETCRLMCQ